MSCRPAIMPPTKTYQVRRLDSTEQDVTLLKKATGGESLDKVGNSRVSFFASGLGWSPRSLSFGRASADYLRRMQPRHCAI